MLEKDNKISYLFFLAPLLMIGVGLFFPFVLLKKGVSWGYVLWGSGAWIVSVVLKIIFALIFNKIVEKFCKERLPKKYFNYIYYFYVGLLTGVFGGFNIWSYFWSI